MPTKPNTKKPLSDEDRTPAAAKQVEGGFEYFFPRHQKTIVADSLEAAQKQLDKEITKGRN
jgi:hypothetical protein